MVNYYSNFAFLPTKKNHKLHTHKIQAKKILSFELFKSYD